MKKLMALICFGFVFAASAPAFAGTQQDKMKSCNKEAKADGLKGDERKAFMKSCLSKDGTPKAVDAADASTQKAAAPTSSQQEKMKTCNADAKSQELKGAERKQFMSACLKA